MKRINTTPRSNWQDIAESNGFHFHHVNGELYWDESVYYSFNLKEIENNLEDPAQEIHEMCLDLVDAVCKKERLMRYLSIPEKYWDFIAKSWKKHQNSIYGRFDFSYNGKDPAKLLEYNADTPTSLYEASYFQWIWLEDLIASGSLSKDTDQFNSIQEELINKFSNIHFDSPMYFGSMKGTEEDRATVEYLMDCAVQGNIDSKFIYMEDIGLKNDQFVDLEDKSINYLFKLYPWEYVWEDEFSNAVKNSNTIYFEPAWKMILSNKGMLSLLWERYKNHPNLLPTFSVPKGTSTPRNFIAKPYFSREGEGIIVGNLLNKQRTPTDNYIIQKMHNLPEFDNNYPVCGLWIVNDKSCGMGIREDKTLITKDTSRFIPHVIKE